MSTVEELRRQKNMSVAQLLGRADISQSTYNRIKQGHPVSFLVASRLAFALDISPLAEDFDIVLNAEDQKMLHGLRENQNRSADNG